jgi:4-azaleucine resistance transporter AzlC
MPFAVTVGILGVSFGALARAIGLDALATVVMSATVFAASAQFAAASVLGAGGGALAALVAGILLNARFAPMGVAVAPYLRGGPLRRAVEAQAVVDTSWALASCGDGRFDRDLLIGATLPQYPAWVGGTALGVLAGPLIGDPEALGLDAVFATFFLALLIGEVRDPRTRGTAALAALVAIALVPVTPPGVPIIAACGAALVGLWRR